MDLILSSCVENFLEFYLVTFSVPPPLSLAAGMKSGERLITWFQVRKPIGGVTASPLSSAPTVRASSSSTVVARSITLSCQFIYKNSSKLCRQSQAGAHCISRRKPPNVSQRPDIKSKLAPTGDRLSSRPIGEQITRFCT